MKVEKLKKLTSEFLKTYGYMAKPIESNAILFSRPTGFGTLDELLIYFHEGGEIIDSDLEKLSTKYSKISEARRFFLTPKPLVPVPETIKKNNFIYQIPVWFFDREFSTAKKLTPLKRLEEEVAKYESERIEQPYTSKTSNGNDLLQTLLNEIEAATEPCVRIIVAPAGYGKTVLMGALYTELKNRFLKNKQKQTLGARPLLMLPGHLKQSTSIDGLINNFIGDEYDYGVANKESFVFWVRNKFVVWMLDGLEELILKIPEEFIYTLLDEYIYAPEGGEACPQIVVAIRESILATSPGLQTDIEEWEGMGLKIYELCDWREEQQKKYFFKNLTKLNQTEIENFIADVNTSDILQKLCSVPYYCSLIADLKNRNQMLVFNNECELVEYAVEKLCEREFGKGLAQDILSVETQKELFSDDELVKAMLKGNVIPKTLFTEIAEIYLGDAADDVKTAQLQCLQRHALLTQFEKDLSFVHEIIKEYMMSLFFLRRFHTLNLGDFDMMEIESNSFIFKNMIRKLANSNINWKEVANKLFELPSSPKDEAKGFRNILRILLCANGEEATRLIKDVVQNKNLSGLIFKNLDMKGFQFQRSKLYSVRFEKCDLSNANFNACYFKDTLFDGECNLLGASIEEAILESVRREDGKLMYDQKEILAYLYKRTQVQPKRKQPCQAVINLRKVLEKLVRKGKGYSMPKKFLISTKCEGGVPSEKCVNASIKYRVLSEEGDYVKIRIDLFDKVKDFTLEPTEKTNIFDQLQKVLDDICSDRNIGCKHIYENNYGKT